jgi:hypothetical protein
MLDAAIELVRREGRQVPMPTGFGMMAPSELIRSGGLARTPQP